MNRKIYLFPLFLLLLSFVACNETEEEGQYDNWRERNEAFIDSLQQVYNLGLDPELHMIPDSRDKKSKIYYKIKKTGPIKIVNGDTIPHCPYYNSKVSVYYRGIYINETVFSKANTSFYTDLYADSDITIFDENFTGKDPDEELNRPSTSRVNGFVSGWIEVLQRMRPGDRFELYVPYQSGYGVGGYYDYETGALVILGASTLIFDVELLRIDDYYYH